MVPGEVTVQRRRRQRFRRGRSGEHVGAGPLLGSHSRLTAKRHAPRLRRLAVGYLPPCGCTALAGPRRGWPLALQKVSGRSPSSLTTRQVRREHSAPEIETRCFLHFFTFISRAPARERARHLSRAGAGAVRPGSFLVRCRARPDCTCKHTTVANPAAARVKALNGEPEGKERQDGFQLPAGRTRPLRRPT